MHIQARAKPSLSPPDLAEFLEAIAGADLLDADKINVEGVTGSSVEDGGFFVFAVTHGRESDCHTRLTRYNCQWTTDLYAERIPPDPGSVEDPDPNQPGVLLGIVQRAKESEVAAGRPISEVLLGAFTDQPGKFFAQVTFVGTRWEDGPPGDAA